MPMSVYDGGTWKTVLNPSVQDGGTWKAVTNAWVYDGGTWKQCFTATPTVTLTPGDTLENGSTATHDFTAQVATVNTGTPTAYLWSVLGADDNTWSILSGQGTNTAVVRVAGVSAAELASGTVTCQVTVNGSPYNGSANLQYQRA